MEIKGKTLALLFFFAVIVWSVDSVAEEAKGIPMTGPEECTKLDVDELRNGDLEAIKARVASGADVNCPIPHVFDSKWSKPLALAVMWPRLEVVEYLVSQGAVIESVRKRYHEESALEVLAWQTSRRTADSGDLLKIAEFLLRELEEPSQEILGMAFVAAAERLSWNGPGDPVSSWHIKLMRQLAGRGLDPNGMYMRYAVHRSVNVPLTLEVILSEFSANADLNVETFSFYGHDKENEPPINAAVYRHMSESVRILLRHGANPNKPDSRGNSPLHLAARNGDSNSVEYLLAAGADPATTNSDGDYPLHLAAKRGDATSVANLLAAKADPDVRDHAGRSPLYFAKLRKHEQVVNIFTEHGYSLDAEDQQRLARAEQKRVAERQSRERERTARAVGRILIDLLITLAWAAYLGAVIWANANGENTFAAAVSKFNLWIGPILAAIAVGAAAGLIFTAMFSTSHGGYAAIANGIPIGIGVGVLALVILGVLNYLFRGNNNIVALVSPMLSIGYPAIALALKHG